MFDNNNSVATTAFMLASALRSSDRLSSAERADGPRKLRQYIDVLVESGERDIDKIALCALGLLREYEQIQRSRATLMSQEAASCHAM
jgi:hypothetical protein